MPTSKRNNFILKAAIKHIQKYEKEHFIKELLVAARRIYPVKH